MNPFDKAAKSFRGIFWVFILNIIVNVSIRGVDRMVGIGEPLGTVLHFLVGMVAFGVLYSYLSGLTELATHQRWIMRSESACKWSIAAILSYAGEILGIVMVGYFQSGAILLSLIAGVLSVFSTFFVQIRLSQMCGVLGIFLGSDELKRDAAKLIKYLRISLWGTIVSACLPVILISIVSTNDSIGVVAIAMLVILISFSIFLLYVIINFLSLLYKVSDILSTRGG